MPRQNRQILTSKKKKTSFYRPKIHKKIAVLTKKCAPKSSLPPLESSICRPQKGVTRADRPPLVTLMYGVAVGGPASSEESLNCDSMN